MEYIIIITSSVLWLFCIREWNLHYNGNAFIFFICSRYYVVLWFFGQILAFKAEVLLQDSKFVDAQEAFRQAMKLEGTMGDTPFLGEMDCQAYICFVTAQLELRLGA